MKIFVLLLSACILLTACAPVTSGAPICHSDGHLQATVSVDVPQLGKIWLCYTPDERSSSPEMARAALLASMAEVYLQRGNKEKGLIFFDSAYAQMPNSPRRAAIAFELAKHIDDPQKALEWLQRATAYVDSSAKAADEYADLAAILTQRLSQEARR